jgi:FtsH-binding integral membrane protein
VVDLHQAVGVLVLSVCAAGGALGAVAYARRREPGRLGRHLLALVQTVLVAQVALGLLLLSDDRRAGDDLHYAYGTLALVAVLAPWMYAPAEPRRRLAWFAGATLLAGALAVRAYTTA